MADVQLIETQDGARIRVVSQGQGPLAVVLHGIGGNSGQWLDAAGAVAPHMATAVWDARGYGGSDGPVLETFSQFADDLTAVIRHLGGGPVLGVGHSMGGRILIETALSHPGLFSALLLSGTQPSYLRHLSEADRQAYVARRLGMFDGDRVQNAMARKVAAEVLPPNAPQALVDRLAADFQRLRRDGYGAALRASAGWDRRADLGNLNIPVEVVGGALDPVCPASETLALAEAAKAEHVTLLDNVSHMLPIEAPDDMARLLRGFVIRHGAATRKAYLSDLAAQ